ncbi:MAG: cyclic dehypoxanthinyl futalosine synthase [Pseudomonadota bacterium]
MSDNDIVRRATEKACADARLEAEEAAALFSNLPLVELGALAHARRMSRHPESAVTYVIDRNVNYTNICVSRCRFCAFWRDESSPEAYVLAKEELAGKIEETLRLGGTQLLLQGGLHPSLPLAWYEDLLRYIKRWPIHVHGFSPPEIVHFSQLAGLGLEETISRLRAAGLDSIPGGGAEILVERLRESRSPGKCSAGEWLEVMAVAHRLGMKTTATMMFGEGETLLERLKHLERLRALQDQTSGFTAFIPWPFQPGNTALGGTAPSAVEYLRTLAVSRLFLDNFANLQASWVTQGAKVGQVALFFGANDFGSTMIEENVVAAAGVSHLMSREEMVRLIEVAGFTARQRNQRYEHISG